MGACISTEPDEKGRSRINVDPERCVGCGACFDACEHNAREYVDDAETFLADLAAGKPISLLIAPAFQANYPDEYERVLGGLKEHVRWFLGDGAFIRQIEGERHMYEYLKTAVFAAQLLILNFPQRIRLCFRF
jgi:ferredoxin